MTATATTAAGPDDDRRSPSPTAILWAVGFSVFVAADDLTVVSTMLRPIIGDLGLKLPDGLDDAAWIVNAYLIAFIAVMPIAGRISDVIGRRRTFMIAYAIFMVGTIWIPLSGSLNMLLAGRVLTALGGGAMVPVALAVVGDVYPAAKRARALGTLGAIETLGWVWGPLYGAMLVRFLSWRWQFWLNVPLALAGAAAVWWALAEHDRPERDARVDWVGAALATTVLVSLNVALLGSAEVQSVQGLDQLTGNNGTDLRWLFLLALASGIAFVGQQRRLRERGGEPLIDTSLFRGRNVRVALIVNFVVGAALVIAMVDVPLFVNAVEVDLERAAVVAGWILSALTAAMAVASYVGGRVTERTWYGPPIILGLVAATGAYTVMGLTWGGDTPYPLLALQLALLGAGIGLTVAPTTSAVVDHADPDSRGAAAAVVMVVRMIGLSVGLSALTAWGLARFNSLRGDIELPPLNDPGFRSALAEATERLTAQSIADTFLASAAALAVGLALCVFLLRRSETPPAGAALVGTSLTNSLVTADPLTGVGVSDATLTDATFTDASLTDSENTMTDRSTDDLTDQLDSDLSGADATGRDHVVRDDDVSAGLMESRDLDTDVIDAVDDVAGNPVDVADVEANDGNSWMHRNLTGVVAALGLLLVGSIVLTLVLMSRLSSTNDELAETREDLDRVEAGSALFASQVNGFVEQVDALAPSIESGLDEAVIGLEEFGTSKIEFTVNIDENISIQENFAISRTVEVPIKTSIPINEEVDTTITIDGPFGVDIPLDITVPVDIDVPIDLVVDIPIDEDIPIDVDVPIKLDVPISIDVEGTELQTLTVELAEGLRAFQESLGNLAGG